MPVLWAAASACWCTPARCRDGRVTGRPLGVLGIVFRWDALAQTIVERTPLSEAEWRRSRVCIVDGQGLLLADTQAGGAARLEFPGRDALFAQPRGAAERIRTARCSAPHAASPGYETYRTCRVARSCRRSRDWRPTLRPATPRRRAPAPARRRRASPRRVCRRSRRGPVRTTRHARRTPGLFLLFRNPLLRAQSSFWLPRMRADVQPGAHFVTQAIENQRFGDAIDHGLYFGEPAVGDVIQCTESHGA